MNQFIKGMSEMENETLTENGGFAYKSTNSALLDLFASCGSLRGSEPFDIAARFHKAYAENPLLATRLAFYARNVRGGLGERDTARTMFHCLATQHPEVLRKNMDLIAKFGRWDDYYCLVGTELELEAFAFLYDRLCEDMECMEAGQPCSLLAKWLKTQGASSPKSRELWKTTLKNFHACDSITKKRYQKMTSALRKYLNVTEVAMSCRRWEDIEYGRVPSNCMMKNKETFKKHDAERFNAYMEAVKAGTEKINASTLFPYDIFRDMGLTLGARGYPGVAHFASPNDVSEAQWKALPDYLNGKSLNALVMADTSGSMKDEGALPLYTALSLAVYFAERNSGEFHNVMMTFSSKPSFIKLIEGSLTEKIGCIPSIVSNTNIELAFQMILDAGVSKGLSNDEMPKSLIIISDMQFDRATSGDNDKTVYALYDEKFKAAGFDTPNIIFWNVNSKRAAYQVFSDAPGIQLVSGSSPAIFKQLFDNIGLTPYQAMESVLNGEDYSMITL